MAYSTYDDIKTAIPEQDMQDLTDDEILDTARTERVTRMIEDADTLINSYLNGRYRVPISDPVPALIRKLSVDLAIYFLHQRTALAKIPEAVRERYTDAIRALDRINGGKVVLDITVAPTTTSSIYGTNKLSTDRIFDNATLARMPGRLTGGLR